jgi:hypothetical protein
MNWLFKEEPTHYSYDDLVRDGKTSWTGVKNPLAQKHLRAVKKGTGSSTTTRATRSPSSRSRRRRRLLRRPEGQDREARRRGRRARQEARASGDARRDQGEAVFKDFPLVRISRLSVMPVSDKEWTEIEKMAGS